jgi:hypothetical protein
MTSVRAEPVEAFIQKLNNNEYLYEAFDKLRLNGILVKYL